jgi:flagellar motor switch/type III secretory pathway protein FliN
MDGADTQPLQWKPLADESPARVTLVLGRLQAAPAAVRNAPTAVDRLVHDPVEVLIDGRLAARGEVVVVDGRIAVRVTELHESQRSSLAEGPS